MLLEIQIFIIQIIDFRKCNSKVTGGKILCEKNYYLN